MIKVTGLTKRYGDRIAVNDVSFLLDKNKIVGFLGPNGAGKSTTMNLITGYIAPDKGSVIVDEISLMKFPQKAKKKIGYLPEIPPLYMDMTVGEYLQFAAELKGVEKALIRKEKERVIRLTRIGGVRERLIRTLSKGYRQRVGIAQALLGNPEILILDEPTVGLDPKQIVEIRKLIQELGKDHTVILSTHILSEVEAVCDEIILISRGKVVAQDTPENLVRFANASQELTLAVRTNATTAERILSAVPGIRQSRVLSEDKDECRIEITAEEKTDLREKLMLAFAEKQVLVLELSVHELSLEDVYLKLTSDTYLDTIFEENPETAEEDEEDAEEPAEEDEEDAEEPAEEDKMMRRKPQKKLQKKPQEREMPGKEEGN